MYLYNNEDSIRDDMMDKIRDLLIDHNKKTGSNIPIDYSIDLSKSQKRAFIKFKMGDSVLILGSAGVGKSALVKEFMKYNINNDNKTMYITSTTGISSYNIGGITINSFMGIGTGEAPVEVLLKRLRYKQSIRNRIIATEILMIDEISMMSAAIFEKIDVIFQKLKRSSKPFGGIQLILTGDFLQLETVFNKKINVHYQKEENQDTRLIIESELFNKMFKKNRNIIILKENFRQSSDVRYIDILTRIRTGLHTKDDMDVLKSRLNDKTDDDMIHLVSSNKKAQEINKSRMNLINSDDHVFETRYTRSGNEETCDLLERELQSQFVQKGTERLILKSGCKVILIKNLNIERGLVNGSIGTIQEIINDNISIKFDNGIKEIITRVDWELELDNSKVICTQIPLMLAYSLTVHKCQSLSLDKAVLDLADCFCNHMVYVALSRVKSLDGVYLKTFNENKITVNKKLLEYIDSIE
jgi:GTPase SAR1 family protein